MILLSKAIRKSEEFTMRNESISSLDLMERAGTECASYIFQHFEPAGFDEIVVLCGPGNNGGDGLVIARLFAQQRLPVKVVLCNESGKTSTEFTENLQRLRALSLSNLIILDFNEADLVLSPNTLVVDALFGIGLSKPLKGYYAEIVDFINSSQSFCIAIDVPSGLFIDDHTPFTHKVVCASITLSFQFQKLAFVMPENSNRIGELVVLDIGLQIPEVSDGQIFPFIEPELVRQILRPIPQYAHKGVFGHAMLIAGSREMPGAAFLAAHAALRAGAGKLTVHLPSVVAASLPVSLPEAMVDVDPHDDYFTSINLQNYPFVNALAIGPGIGRNPKTKAALSMLIDEVQIPMVLDADALNILAENKTWLAYLPAGSILTPHPKEFERLAGKAENDFDRLEKAKYFAKRYGIILILKGCHSVVAMPDGNLFFNNTGNPGMATAGSGDVLTGLLLGLLARGYQPEEASLLGVYLHGLAGDMAVEDAESMESLLASDIYKNIGRAYRKMRS
ncbi:NAD(P)H-hydrate dehydratase [Bacteroidales bacterium OttesenSCG-928-B11]|nr:NAD(P)H-hydrate dehydratase [Bacteroidales bacterium OttesenSCG-928-C03]MDL2312398.1 NAD(P)H-hydrate dehydratase [Bacteroidales bacterium OttesenSCG-928-B11]